MTVQNISPVQFESVSAVTATPSVELGTRRTHDGQSYVYLFNCGISTASVGYGLVRPASAAAGLYSCSVSSASGDQCQGFVKHADIPTLNYGWAVTDGLVGFQVASAASTVAAGAVALGANGNIATHTVGYCVGQVLTSVVSGNSLVGRVKVI